MEGETALEGNDESAAERTACQGDMARDCSGDDDNIDG